jgi:hypothetical protein
MLKNMKLGAKISLGFAMVICLASVLGALGVVSMNVVRKDASILAAEYMPEVELCNMVERNSLLTMYAARGYALTEEASYLETAKTHLGEVDKYLEECGKLAEEAEHLVKLGPAVESTRKLSTSTSRCWARRPAHRKAGREPRHARQVGGGVHGERQRLPDQPEREAGRRDQEGHQGRQAERTPREGHGGQ